MPILMFSPVANFGYQSLDQISKKYYFHIESPINLISKLFYKNARKITARGQKCLLMPTFIFSLGLGVPN